jgi:hypothetical protein
MLSWGISEHLQHSNRDVRCKGQVEINSSTVDGGCGSSPVSVESDGPQGKPAVDLLLGPGVEAAGADGPGTVSKPAFVFSVLRELSVGLCRGNCVTYTDSQGIKQQCKLCDDIHAPPLSRRREPRPFGAPAAMTADVPTTRGFAPGLRGCTTFLVGLETGKASSGERAHLLAGSAVVGRHAVQHDGPVCKTLCALLTLSDSQGEKQEH